MNIIELYDNLNGSYKSYLESFVAIKDERIKEKVSDSIKNEKLWPKALIQFNPNFKNGIAIMVVLPVIIGYFRLFLVIFGHFRLFFDGSSFMLWIKKSITLHDYALTAKLKKSFV